MIGDNVWMQRVDHRISTALILFLLLLLLDNANRRRRFALRAGLSLLVMCGASWCMRYGVETALAPGVAQSVGYSLYIGAMSMLFMGCYALCYHVRVGALLYVSLLAMTVYKLAWNLFKAAGYAVDLSGIGELWSRYSVLGSLVSYAVYGAVCVSSCAVFRVCIRDCGSELPVPRFMLAAFLCFTGCQMMLELCGHMFTQNAQALFLYYFCALLYTTTNYIVLLIITRLLQYRRDNEDMQVFIQNKMQYYQMSRDSITALQVKCHDLKHQIAAIRSKVGKESFDRYIDRLEDSILEYGTVVECGNETIDIVLTEKNSLCSSFGVKFSYIIDGTLFDFMSEMELFSLFGNALDNALESCSKVKDPARRVISLKAARNRDMVVLHVENSFDAPLRMVDGMPVTTKDGTGHGFGLRSIQEIARRYDGMASVQAENHIFKLTVALRPTATT